MDKKVKNRVLAVVAVSVLVLGLIAAFWVFNRGNESYCSVIPDNAVALFRVDGKQLKDKFDVDLTDQKNLPVALIATMIEKSGVDFSKPIYAFACPDRKSGLVIPIDDVVLFRDFLKDNGLVSFSLSESNGFEWAMGGQYAAIFDSEKCLILSGGGMYVRKELLKLMEQDEDDSVIDESLYKSISKSDKPIAAIISLEAAKKTLPTMSLGISSLPDDALDIDVLLGFDVKGEKAVLAVDIIPNSSEAEEMLKNQTKQLSPLKGKFVNTIDSNPLLWLSFGGFNTLSQQMAAIPELEELKAMGVDAAKLLEGFSGEAAIVVPSSSVNDFIFLAEVKNGDILDFLNQSTSSAPGQIQFVKVDAHNYVSSLNGQAIFVGVKDNTFYLTNSQNLVSKVGLTINSSVAEYQDEISSSTCYLNINAQNVINALPKLVPQSASVIMLMGSRLSKLDRLYFTSQDTHAELVLSAVKGEDLIDALFK